MAYIPPVRIPSFQTGGYGAQLNQMISGMGDPFVHNRDERTRQDEWQQNYARGLANDARSQANSDRQYALDLQRLEQGRGAGEYFGTPIYREGPDGIEAWQLGKDGQPVRVDFGEGGQIMFPESTTDLGGRVRVGDKYGTGERFIPKTGGVGTDLTTTEFDPVTGEPLTTVPRQGSPAEREAIKDERKISAESTKARTSLAALEQRGEFITSKIDEAIGNISGWTTGYGAMLDILPASAARKLKNDLDTIKANIGFGELQSMRDNSPTGGALGQVSEFENRLLQAVQGALDTLQDGGDVRANLEEVRRLREQTVTVARIAYMVDFEGLDRATFGNAVEAIRQGADPNAVLAKIQGGR